MGRSERAIRDDETSDSDQCVIAELNRSRRKFVGGQVLWPVLGLGLMAPAVFWGLALADDSGGGVREGPY